MFGMYENPFFTGKLLTCTHGRDDDMLVRVDEDFMCKEALAHARCMIQMKKSEAYKTTKNIDIFKASGECREATEPILILSNLRTQYETELRKLSQESRSEDLRQLLARFLSYTVKVFPHQVGAIAQAGEHG